MELPYSRKTCRCCNSHSANTYFATEFVSSKINVIPYPSTLNYKLSVRTATSNQLNICKILTRTSAKFWHQHLVLQTYLAIGKHIKVSDWFLTKNRWWNTYWQRSKKNIKADIPINKLFGENLFDHHSHQFQNLFETEEAFWSSASAEHWFLENKVYKREFLLIFAYSELLTRELRA